jgi:hypothetical protein
LWGKQNKKGKWKNKWEESAAGPKRVLNQNSSDDNHKNLLIKTEEGRGRLIKGIYSVMIVNHEVTSHMRATAIRET